MTDGLDSSHPLQAFILTTERERYCDIIIPTGLNDARNVLVVASGDIIVALPGSHGTRSEIAIALKIAKPVIGVGAWSKVAGVRHVKTVEELIQELLPYF